MADYIYLLENRLSPAQRNALRIAREVARTKGLTIFLVGGAVRDLTSGSPVRDLDVVVQGNALKFKKDIEKAGAVVTGENDSTQALYLRLPGHVRMELGSTVTVTFPKPGKPAVKPATILDDLRRRDFTANAMALSLNEGSYGLLMDPLNGTADIENRNLRLVSNYGFIEDPVRMIKAARLMARLGWTMDERTQARYDTGKDEGYISVLSDFHRGYELEEVVHEEDPLRVMRGLEAEGWMKQLSPFWTSAKTNAAELDRLREIQTQLELQEIHPDNGAANFPLLTAKLSASEVASLKAAFPRQGFVAEIEDLERVAKEFASQLTSKSSALPSQSWRTITSAPAEAVLWVAYSNKSAAVQNKLKAFSTEWPQARQKMPYTQMLEMRITPDLPEYESLLEKLFFELMDGNLQTPEELKAFLEPYSPPAPPPPVNLRRMRAPKKEPKPRASKAKAKAAEVEPAIGTESAAPEAGATPAPVAESIRPTKGAPAKAAAAPATKAAPAAAQKTTPKPEIAAKPSAAAKAKAQPTKAVRPMAAPAKHSKSHAAAKPAAPARKTAAAPAKKSTAKKASSSAATKSSKKTAQKTAAQKKTAQKATVPQKKSAKSGARIPAKKAPTKKVLNRNAAAAKSSKPTARKAAPAKKAPAKKAVAKRPEAKKPAPKAVSHKSAKGKAGAKGGRRR